MNLNIFQSRSLKTRVTLFMLAIFLLGIWSLSFYASRMLREDMERLLGEQQFSTASFMAAEVNGEMDDRLKALERIAGEVSPAMLGNTAAMQTHLEQHTIFQVLFNGGTFVTRNDGTAIAEVTLSAGRRGTNFMGRDFMIAALRQGKAAVSQPSMGKQAPVFYMAVPIRDPRGSVIGALAGATNLTIPNFLDKVTENRYGKTGGYLLVAPQHRMIVTASDKTRIMETSPTPGIHPLTERFNRGYEGSGVEIDPHGVEVLASAKSVPVAGWYVLVALPTAEAFAPIHAMQQRILLATLFLTLLAGGLIWWILRRQLFPVLAAMKSLAALPGTNHLTQPLPITSQDEIGELIGGFNRLLQNLAQREEAKEEAPAILQKIASRLPGVVYQYRLCPDGSSCFPFASDAIREIYRVTQDDVREDASKVFAVLHPDDYDCIVASIQKSAQDLTAWSHEYRVKFDDGTVRWLYGNAMPQREADGGVLWHGFITDVTGRKQVELKASALIHRNQVLMDNAMEGIHILDERGNLMEANRSFCRLLGYTHEEMLHLNVADWEVKMTPDELRIAIGQLLDGQAVFDTLNRRKDGSVIDVEVSVVGVELDGRKCLYVSSRDITGRKESEHKQRQLSEQINRYADEISDLYESAPCGYHSLDNDGCIQHINRTELGWLGYTWDEVVGKMKWPDLITPASRRIFQENFPKLKMQGFVHDLEIETIRKDGTILPVLISATAVYDADGNFVASRSTVYDMTERKIMEQERISHMKQMEDASRHLVATQEDARRRLSSELHDRTSPNLAAIDLNLNIIAAELPQEHAADIVERLEDTRALITDTAASIRDICADMRPPLLDYAGLAAALESYIQQFTRRTGIAVRFDCVNHDARYAPDLESLLFRIFQEALTNCAKHARATSVIVTLSNGGYPLVLTITDDGVGFDPALLGKTGPIGLGMLNMREMAEIAGGRFAVESAPGKGTHIAVEISRRERKTQETRPTTPLAESQMGGVVR